MIYHVARHADWHSAIEAGEYTVSSAAATLADEGFIHASERHQVAGVISRFYRGETDLVVLVIDESAVLAAGVAVRREDVGGELFPHIYGAIDPAWVIGLESAATF